MSVEEKLIVVHEEDGEPTGETVFRSELIKDKKWGRSTNVFVLNPEGKILCHQRSFKKERYPGIWMTHFGGHVTEGESFKINALKEMEEELGIKVPAVQMIPWRTSRKDALRLNSKSQKSSRLSGLLQKKFLKHLMLMTFRKMKKRTGKQESITSFLIINVCVQY